MVCVAAIGMLFVIAVGEATAQTRITVDGWPQDWAGIDPAIQDPVGDSEPGVLDLGDVYVQGSDEGLYFLAMFADPVAGLAQFDLVLQVGDRSFVLSCGKTSGSAFIGEVTADYVPIDDSRHSRFAYGSAWEGFVSIEDLPASGDIFLEDLRVMVGECCDHPVWHAADWLRRVTAGTQPEFHPVRRIDEPALYAGQGLDWGAVGVSLRNLPGYSLEQVWASAFSLSTQIDRVHDGSIVVGDTVRNRIIRLSEDGVESLADDVNPNWIATLVDGRVVHYSRTGNLMALDPQTGHDSLFAPLPGEDSYRSPVAVDALGRIYGIDSSTRTLIRVSAGGLERLTGALPYAEHWHITDIEVAVDGTVYIAGFNQVVAVSNHAVRTIADGLQFEPVFIDLGDDGTLYINELAKGFQAYSPDDGSLRSVECSHGFLDFVVTSFEDAVFYDSQGGYYHMNLETMEKRTIVRSDPLNASAFAAGANGSVVTATACIGSWGAHLVRLFSDGHAEDLDHAAYWRISSADVDFAGRLCYIADESLYRMEEDGSLTSWPLCLPGEPNLFAAGLACTPDGAWVVLTCSAEEVRIYRVGEGGQGHLLPVGFDRSSFGDLVALIDDARVDVGSDGRIALIVAARGTPQHGPYIQRVYQTEADGSGLDLIGNLDCNRVAGMVDVAVDSFGVVYALGVTGDTGDADVIFRIVPGQPPVQAVSIEAGRDPRSIDIGADGTLWFGTTLGVFRVDPP